MSKKEKGWKIMNNNFTEKELLVDAQLGYFTFDRNMENYTLGDV